MIGEGRGGTAISIKRITIQIDLMAYADDIVLIGSAEEEIKVLTELLLYVYREA